MRLGTGRIRIELCRIGLRIVGRRRSLEGSIFCIVGEGLVMELEKLLTCSAIVGQGVIPPSGIPSPVDPSFLEPVSESWHVARLGRIAIVDQ